MNNFILSHAWLVVDRQHALLSQNRHVAGETEGERRSGCCCSDNYRNEVHHPSRTRSEDCGQLIRRKPRNTADGLHSFGAAPDTANPFSGSEQLFSICFTSSRENGKIVHIILVGRTLCEGGSGNRGTWCGSDRTKDHNRAHSLATWQMC